MTNPHPEDTIEISAAAPELHGPGDPLEVASSPERRSARLAMYAGIALAALGSIILYLGYNGAATHPVVAEQMPYVISGGFAGASLIMLGAVMILAHVVLGMQGSLRADIQELREALEDMSDSVSGPVGAGPASSNGFVVALKGGSSFHRPGCRLVANRNGLRRLGAGEADRRGLAPCRVCDP